MLVPLSNDQKLIDISRHLFILLLGALNFVGISQEVEWQYFPAEGTRYGDMVRNSAGSLALFGDSLTTIDPKFGELITSFSSPSDNQRWFVEIQPQKYLLIGSGKKVMTAGLDGSLIDTFVFVDFQPSWQRGFVIQNDRLYIGGSQKLNDTTFAASVITLEYLDGIVMVDQKQYETHATIEALFVLRNGDQIQQIDRYGKTTIRKVSQNGQIQWEREDLVSSMRLADDGIYYLRHGALWYICPEFTKINFDGEQIWTTSLCFEPTIRVSDYYLTPHNTITLSGQFGRGLDTSRLFVMDWSTDSTGNWQYLSKELGNWGSKLIYSNPRELHVLAGQVSPSGFTSYVIKLSIKTTHSELPKLSTFPNPCTDYINIRGLLINGEVTTYRMMDWTGRLVMSGNSQESINTTSLAAGVYFLHVEGYNTAKIVKL